MNVITRGAKNALRSPLRSGAVIIMMAISIGLILSMLVARSSVIAKINEVKATTGTSITINPAGVQGGMGGGDPLTAEQVAKITSTSHVTKVTSTLTDQLGTDDTSLESSLDLGSLGQRMQRFEGGGDAGSSQPIRIQADGPSATGEAPKPRTSVTGTNTPPTTVPTDKITSGEMIDGDSDALVAMIGKDLAEKNSLNVGDTFTAYGKKITVKAIFETGNTFQDSGIVTPLTTLQNATDQKDAVSSATATVDSAENVSGTLSNLKTALGDKADITSQEEQAKTALEPLQSIASLATAGVIGAAIAGTAIILLSMIMIVRERRREIGVIKAIGGSNSKVITQFMTEGLTLAVAGGIIGLGLGVLVSGPMTESLVSGQTSTSSTSGPMNATSGPSSGAPRIMRSPGQQINANLQQVTSTLTPQIFFSSIGIMLAVAIIGSAVPAWFIARIRPAEVLRTE